MRKKAASRQVTIKTVSVRSSIQLKSFQHLHIEVSAEVHEDQTPSEVIDTLKTFVAKELKIAKEGRVVPQPAVQGRFLDKFERD